MQGGIWGRVTGTLHSWVYGSDNTPPEAEGQPVQQQMPSPSAAGAGGRGRWQATVLFLSSIRPRPVIPFPLVKTDHLS